MDTFNFKNHLLLYILAALPLANPLNFSYNGYSGQDLINMPKPDSGNSSIDSTGIIELTTSTAGQSLDGSCGWVSYIEPFHLWNPHTSQQATFSTHFSFIINANVTGSSISASGDGLAFYMSSYPHTTATNSSGGQLCLFTNRNNTNLSSQVVAVEFDTYQNSWDPDDHHVGINIDMITSATNYTLQDNNLMKNGTVAYAWITYDTQKNLTVYLTYEDNGNTARPTTPILSYQIDLAHYLPHKVAIGFSAATGTRNELHQILTWDFNSTSAAEPKRLVVFFVVLGVIGLVIILVALVWFIIWRKKPFGGNAEEISESDEPSEDFDENLSKNYTYKSLVIATSNFSEENKLGEGGFGPVFKGVLRDQQCYVAVKRVSNSKGSSEEGLKEYKAEVKVLSKLNHRNLVKLKGWCEEKEELLLVYELMPKGSLHSQLYSKDRLLSWAERYKIALGLAAALNYLHEECERCIFHRDIKPGNVLLDSEFNAKLSDFGLARLVNHDHTSQKTLKLFGTQGYLAPEYYNEGRVSKESDIYSFGVVLLEMACGRPPLVQKGDETTLIEFVWDHYGRREILKAADKRINGEYDEQEMECILVVGLWCVHPSYTERPTISQAISVLKLSTPLPDLPSNKPSLFFLPVDQRLLFEKTFASSSTGGLSVSTGNVTRSSHVSSSTSGSSSMA